MPRPFKIGLDYFPLDTDFFGNKKIKSLRRAHGEIGILTYLNLLSRVYKNGYFYKFDDLEDLSMDIAEEIACSQLRSVAARVTETINYLVGRETLAEGLFKQGIISGVSLQEQYVISAYKAKRNIKMDVHCLVDVDEVISKFKNNSEETQVNSELSTQSKSNSKSNSKKKLKSLSITTTTTTATTPKTKRTSTTSCLQATWKKQAKNLWYKATTSPKLYFTKQVTMVAKHPLVQSY